MPVLGNGDIWSADDAAAHGRARPDATASSSGADASAAPGCSATSRRPSARRARRRRAVGQRPDASARSPRRSAGTPSCSSSSSTSEERGCRDIRKHVAWYFKGYPVGGELRAQPRARSRRSPQLDDLLGDARLGSAVSGRGRRGSARARGHAEAPALPDGWLDSPRARRRCTQQPRRAPSSTRAAADAWRARPFGGYGEVDRERWLPEEHASRRSDFARDRARLLHSSALRRLAAKTQVLSPTAGLDFARNRLTHSLEVAQVGRELGGSPRLDPDVVDTACLAHDLGHPPFGHNGERALNELGRRHRRVRGQRADPATAHAARAEGVRRPTAAAYGLNLTRASLDASCKYPWPADLRVADPSGRREVRLLHR